MTAKDIKDALEIFADEKQAAILSRFFKTGKGEYGEGDRFWGIRVPQTRSVAKEAIDASLHEIGILLDDPVHEVRLCGFLILVFQFQKAKSSAEKEKIVGVYLANAKKANNWDLVDLSAPKILGKWLIGKDRTVLYDLAASDNLWEQRIAIVSTWTIIREREYHDTLSLACILIDHPHDLIRKAVGWMLREVGKKDQQVLLGFLDEYATRLSRTSLRYALERQTPEVRKRYMTLGK